MYVYVCVCITIITILQQYSGYSKAYSLLSIHTPYPTCWSYFFYINQISNIFKGSCNCVKYIVDISNSLKSVDKNRTKTACDDLKHISGKLPTLET